jgi:hypothetical protein
MEVDIIAGPTRDSTRRLISITNFGTKHGERGLRQWLSTILRVLPIAPALQ